MAKLVTLAAPWWDELLGRSRMPIEGPFAVSDELAAELKDEGVLAAEAEDAPDAILPETKPKAKRAQSAANTTTRRQASEPR